MIGEQVVYIDPQGQQHNALVTGVNGQHPDALDLVYVLRESGEVMHKFGILHEDHESKDENNPALLRTAVNAWRDFDFAVAAQARAEVEPGEAKLEDQPAPELPPADEDAVAPPTDTSDTSNAGVPAFDDLDAEKPVN